MRIEEDEVRGDEHNLLESGECLHRDLVGTKYCRSRTGAIFDL